MMWIIANENAGSGSGKKVLERTEELLRQKNIPFLVKTTKGPGDAGKFAAEAMDQGARDLICLGGDGTNFEIINGLNGRFASLVFVPCGTGNDFIKMFGYPRDPIQALESQLNGIPRRIDVGKANDLYFLNVSGSGFDVEVLKQAARYKHLGQGLLPYLMGLFSALKHFRPLPVEMTADGKTERKEITIFSVGNGSYIGGGMKAVPDAKTDDGLFDVVVADRMSTRSILRFLKKFIAGKHTELKEIHCLRCSELTVRCPGMTVDLDGELIPMDEVHYQLIPGAVEIRVPESDAG
ncbi:MAG: diacylglycerol kinase family lipid kinase [Clostridia bacterium]|nr:diacylglycerol kinase family lipid kinase [Clostridia bacterium]